MMIKTDQLDANWDALASSLDAALEDLKGEERDTLFLRYFERKSAQEIAAVLGTTEAAAQKRVSRAVERLREIFAARGVTVSATALAAALVENSVRAAPTALVASISTAVINGSIVSASVTTATKVITMTTLQKAVITTVLIATAATAAFEGIQANNFEQKLRSGATTGTNLVQSSPADHRRPRSGTPTHKRPRRAARPDKWEI